ncbi:hotdog fold thioesterase [Filobacillus milosensis]|uniref:Hotdog fold thioesterase n=1 Tax=Filobacillus milosensis TaxID=94137 RepID=A0A4Y8IF78_9BACI|nr:hotdog fold thioesterase [Filobacillus milosensis]TFB13787.1 hotdog fold thioesterase [Filobacillus milosensis]
MQLENTLFETLSIETVKAEKDQVILKMPVTPTVHQPLGYLHGGASVALAESAASLAGFLNIDPEHYSVFGVEINANHVKSKREGYVQAIANPIHIGRTTMVWEIKIVDESEQLISISRCTLGVVERKK